MGLAAALLMSSCLYDSGWAEPKRAQQAAAQRATPSALRATPEAEGEAGSAPSKKRLRPLKLRARATPRYAAEVVDWQRQLADLVTDANEVLGPTLSVRLEVTAVEVWAPHGTDDDLLAMLDELTTSDPGGEVEWVIGLIGSVPRFEQSFHQLGLGRAGKHFVVRAMNDAREYEAIQNNLFKLDEQERRKLYRIRKRHKTTAVFLHELGHTLGVIHELDRTTLMAPAYDSKEEGFSAAAAGWMRIALDHRLDPAAHPERAFTQTMLDHLQSTAPGWVAAERDDLVARLRARQAASAPRAPGASPPAASAPGDLVALGPPDRRAFDEASEALRSGQPRDAWARAKPLFAAYPDVYTVQDLRCQIAMKLGLGWDEANAQCERLMELTPTSRGAPKR
jgi:metallopeptidase family M12-like protein